MVIQERNSVEERVKEKLLGQRDLAKVFKGNRQHYKCLGHEMYKTSCDFNKNKHE